MKKLLILATAIAALGALMVPVVAQAETEPSLWTHDNEVLKEDIVIPVHGSAGFTGGTTCPEVTGSFELFEESSEGRVLSFEVPNPEACEVKETLAILGCQKLVAATSVPIGEGPELNWPVDNNYTDVTITGMEILNHYSGVGFCPKTVTISGNVTAVPESGEGKGNTEAIKALTLHGVISSSLGTKPEVSGTLTPSNEADVETYGLH